MFHSLKKIAKAVLAVFALFTVGQLGLVLALLIPVHRIGRVDRRKGARLLLRAIKILQVTTQLNPQVHIVRLVRYLLRRQRDERLPLDKLRVVALLGQGATWEQIKPFAQREARDHRPNSSSIAHSAFTFYLVEEKYDDAYNAALLRCKTLEEKMAGQEEAMKRYFMEEGTQHPTKTDLRAQEYARKFKDWEANPQGQPRPECPGERISMKEFKKQLMRNESYLNYYNAHFCLEILRWIQTLNEEQLKQVADAVREKSRPTLAWLSSLYVNENLARSMGMDEATLSEIRQRLTQIEP